VRRAAEHLLQAIVPLVGRGCDDVDGETQLLVGDLIRKAKRDRHAGPIETALLYAADLGATSSTLGAGRELTLQATLQATLPDSEPLAGYTIDLFYP